MTKDNSLSDTCLFKSLILARPYLGKTCVAVMILVINYYSVPGQGLSSIIRIATKLLKANLSSQKYYSKSYT